MTTDFRAEHPPTPTAEITFGDSSSYYYDNGPYRTPGWVENAVTPATITVDGETVLEVSVLTDAVESGKAAPALQAWAAGRIEESPGEIRGRHPGWRGWLHMGRTANGAFFELDEKGVVRPRALTDFPRQLIYTKAN